MLLTHVPPHGVLDGVPFGPDRHGHQQLRREVFRAQPRLHVFGHAHEQYGVQNLGRTKCLNAAQAELHHRHLLLRPTIIDIGPNTLRFRPPLEPPTPIT